MAPCVFKIFCQMFKIDELNNKYSHVQKHVSLLINHSRSYYGTMHMFQCKNSNKDMCAIKKRRRKRVFCGKLEHEFILTKNGGVHKMIALFYYALVKTFCTNTQTFAYKVFFLIYRLNLYLSNSRCNWYTYLSPIKHTLGSE